MSRTGLMISAAILLIINTSGCSKQPHAHAKKIDYNTIELSNSFVSVSESDTSIFLLKISFQNPTNQENDSIIQKLRMTMLKDLISNLPDACNAPEIAMNKVLLEKANVYSGKKTNKQESYKDSSRYAKKHDIAIHTVTFCDKNLVSYVIKNDKMIDEAHPLTKIQGYSLDLQKFEKIQEEDLFDDNSLPIVHDLILKKLEANNHVNSLEELEQIGFFDLSEIALFKNFYINEKGVTYVYNPYEIGSYALGTMEVLLTFEDLKNLIMPDSPLTQLLQK